MRLKSLQAIEADGRPEEGRGYLSRDLVVLGDEGLVERFEAGAVVEESGSWSSSW